MKKSRIYADFNGLQGSPRNPSRRAVALDTYGTLRELSNAGIRLHDNLELVIYDYSDEEEDLESHVSVYWDKSRKVWLAEIDEKGILYIPKHDRSNSNEFLCLNCRVPLQEFIQKNGMDKNTVCPNCGEKIVAAIEQPK
jgi:DNA-directed RNA polymerase subunit RPC12/RpoP